MRADPPLTPDGDQARRWAKEELSKGKYGDHRSLLERAVDALRHLLDRVLHATAGNSPTTWVTIAVLLLLVGGGYALWHTRRPERHSAGPPEVVFGDPELSSAQLRRRSEAAERSGDLDTAVVERFRAIARAAHERSLLVGALDSATTHDVTTALVRAFGEHAGAIRRAGDTFDQVRYGHLPADTDDVRRMRELDAALTHAGVGSGAHA